MKILYITPYVPNRIRVRPYQFLRALAQQHEVILLTAQSAKEEIADLDHLRTMKIRVESQEVPLWRSMGNCASALLSGSCLQASFSWHAELARRVARVIEEIRPDVVHVEHLRGAKYGLYAQSYFRINAKQPWARTVPVVWDSVDSISHLYEQASQHSQSLKWRLMAQMELERTRRYEGWLVQKFDQVVVTSPVDKGVLVRLSVQPANGQRPADEDTTNRMGAKINVVSNGVDLDYFVPTEAQRETASIVLTGKMSYHANVTAALHLVKDIMPGVWQHRPDAEVWLVGKDPSPQVRALATAAGDTQRRVIVTGTVPDLRPYLQRATIAVAPIPYGAGSQNKVLEAMACAAPVIASPQAASAYAMRNGCEMLIAPDVGTFIDTLIHLLGNPQIRYEIGRGGRAYVERHYSWNRAASCLEQVYRKAVQIRRTTL